MVFSSFNNSNIVRSSAKILEAYCKNNTLKATSVLYNPQNANQKVTYTTSTKIASQNFKSRDIPIRFSSSSSTKKRLVSILQKKNSCLSRFP